VFENRYNLDSINSSPYLSPTFS